MEIIEANNNLHLGLFASLPGICPVFNILFNLSTSSKVLALAMAACINIHINEEFSYLNQKNRS